MRKCILIIDSDDRQIRRIAKVISDTAKDLNKKAEIYAAHNIEDADRLLRAEKVDVLILDTVYKGFKQGEYWGIDWVKSLRKMGQYFFLPVIFVSSMEEPKEYAYKKLNCIGFLPRAFSQADFSGLLKKALQCKNGQDEENYIIFRKQGILYPLQVKYITHVEMEKRQLHIYRSDGNVLRIPHKTLAEVQEESVSHCLFRCNRSTLVNKYYVELVDLKDRYLVIKGSDARIKIGRAYMDTVKWKIRNESGLVYIKSQNRK